MFQDFTSVRIFCFEYTNETQPPLWRCGVWSFDCFIFGRCQFWSFDCFIFGRRQCPCLTLVITIPLHRYPLPPLSAFAAVLMPSLLFQGKLVSQIFERKLSAGYLYAAPPQKCRFKETAICIHEGSRCCTIKGNLKARGRWQKDNMNPKLGLFFVVADTNTKIMFYFAPSSPLLKTLAVFWATATKCHFSF